MGQSPRFHPKQLLDKMFPQSVDHEQKHHTLLLYHPVSNFLHRRKMQHNDRRQILTETAIEHSLEFHPKQLKRVLYLPEQQ